MNEQTNFNNFICLAPSIIPFMSSNICHSPCVIHFTACPIKRIRDLGFRVLRSRICQIRFVVPQLQHTFSCTCYCSPFLCIDCCWAKDVVVAAHFKIQNTNRRMRFRRIGNALLFMIVNYCWRFRV